MKDEVLESQICTGTVLYELPFMAVLQVMEVVVQRLRTLLCQTSEVHYRMEQILAGLG